MCDLKKSGSLVGMLATNEGRGGALVPTKIFGKINFKSFHFIQKPSKRENHNKTFLYIYVLCRYLGVIKDRLSNRLCVQNSL